MSAFVEIEHLSKVNTGAL